MVPARQQKATYRPDWEYSGAIEMVVWAIPALTDHAARRDRLDRQPRPRAEQAARSSEVAPLKVEVVSLDWKWLFIYPDQGVATVNQLVVPAGTPVSFRLTSATVWNSFFVPQMGTMIYTMPRHDDAAEPAGGPARESTTACRRISAATASPACSSRSRRCRRTQFATWAQGARGAGPALDGRGYAELSKPSSYVKPMTYGAVAPGLFDAIVATGHRSSTAAAAAASRQPAVTEPGG